MLIVRHHPTKLTDDDLAELLNRSFANWQAAPHVFRLIVEFAQAEQIRRLKACRGDFIEPEMMLVPVTWDGAQLGRALQMVTCLSLTSQHEGAGEFFDCMCHVVNAVAASRLERLGKIA